MGVTLVLLRHGEGRQLSIVTTGFGLGIALGPLLAGAWIVYRYVPEMVDRSESSVVNVQGAAQPAESK